MLFERRRKYNVPVHMCVHPELCQYVREVLASLLPLIREGTADRVWLTVQNKVSGHLASGKVHVN